MRIIALCGVKRSGKDTVADYLVARHAFKKVEIARPLKDVLRIMFDFTDEQLDGDCKEVELPRYGPGVTPRRIMQHFGTEMMQSDICKVAPDLGRSIWVDKSIRTTRSHVDQGHDVVISDMRFLHEADALSAAFDGMFNIIKVRREEAEQTADTHASEAEWMSIQQDFEVYNRTNLFDLYKDVEAIMQTPPCACRASCSCSL